MEIIYLVLPHDEEVKVCYELEKGDEDNISRPLNTYNVRNDWCECVASKKHADCIHQKIWNWDLSGPEVPPVELDNIVGQFKQGLLPVTETVMAVGNTRLRKNPVTRIDLIGESAVHGAELWSYIGPYLVRFITANSKTYDVVFDLLNDQVRFGLPNEEVWKFLRK